MTEAPVSETSPLAKLTYERYLQVPALLSLQHLLSPHHDEMLFILIHQIYELWFKCILHELQEVMACFERNDVQRSCKVLNRVLNIQKVLVTQIDVLETMTPVEFAEFRENLRPASGFQSIQFREVEFLSGLKNVALIALLELDEEARARLEKRRLQPTLYDCFLRLLHRRGFPISDTVLNRDVSTPYGSDPAVLSAIEAIYRDTEHQYDLYLLCEALLSYDENIALWRYRHIQMVERTIGKKPGTGGSPGVEYLSTTLNKRCFPELWEVRTLLGAY